MRALILHNVMIVLLLFWNSNIASEETEKFKKEEFRKIVDKIPSQTFIEICQHKSRNDDNVKNNILRDNPCQSVQNNIARVEDVRAMITLGSNVFEYPGLISIGKIGYHAVRNNSYVYVLRIPASLKLDDKVIIVFDENGVITDTKKVNSSTTTLSVGAEDVNKSSQNTSPVILAQCSTPLKQCRVGVSTWCCNSGKRCDYDNYGCK